MTRAAAQGRFYYDLMEVLENGVEVYHVTPLIHHPECIRYEMGFFYKNRNPQVDEFLRSLHFYWPYEKSPLDCDTDHLGTGYVRKTYLDDIKEVPPVPIESKE